MDYIQVPEEVLISEIRKRDSSWSPGMYQRIPISAPRQRKVRELLSQDNPYDRGSEPGSIWYMKSSNRYLIRTKALQSDSVLLYPKGDAIIPLNPRAFEDPQLRDGDILLSKDSNAGETAIVDGDQWKNYMFSGGILRLNPICDRYYLFSFLKHPLFKAQLLAMAPRGATITHARTLWLDCFIPFPNQDDSERVEKVVSALMRAVIDKELEIRRKNRVIDQIIESEILSHQNVASEFSYVLPDVREIRALGRVDAALYSEYAKRELFRLSNYVHGTATYKELGFAIGRGQNLQVSCIGVSIYSDFPRPGFYRLAAPTDLSEFRTVRQFRYLGNKRTLSLLKKGDVVFGAEGFCKGRVVILADEVQRTISNIHGITFHSETSEITKGIFLGCFLGYLRAKGLVDIIGAGGSGGSLAIGYFHLVPIPKFPESTQKELAKLYHNPAAVPEEAVDIENLVDWHRHWNLELGIWELDREMKVLQNKLQQVQERIIQGKSVEIELL